MAPKILNTFLCCFSFYFEKYTEEILEKNVKPSRVVIQPLVPPPPLPSPSSLPRIVLFSMLLEDVTIYEATDD